MPPRARSATAAVPAPDADAVPAAGPKRAAATKPAAKPAAKTARPADKLAKLGLRHDVDLVLHLPMRYEDETTLLTIAEAIARANTGWAAQVEGAVTRNEVALRPRRQLVVHIADDSGELVLRFLNFYGSQVKQMAEGVRLRVRGEVRGGFFGAEMVHPTVRAVAPDEPLPDRLTR
ncbi:ATP-dependent DNA helicase RecG, partial [Ralstonia solanacearum]